MLFNPVNKYAKEIKYIFFGVLFIWPIFFVLRGIDCMDSGYYLSNYKYIFSGDIEPDLSFAFTNLLGGLYYLITPIEKFVAFRVLDWFYYSIAWFFVYKLFSKYVPDIWLFPSIIIGATMLRRYPMMLSYNTFSFVHLIIAIYFLIRGIEKNSKKLIILSGFIIGINVFFRIPNALQAILVFVPLWYGLATKNHNSKKAWKQALQFTIGGLLGLLLSLLLVSAIYGFGNVMDSIIVLFNASKSDGSTHSVLNVLSRIGTEIYLGSNFIFKYLLPLLGISMIISAVLMAFKSKMKLKTYKLIWSIVIVVILFIAYIFSKKFSQSYFVMVIGVLGIISSILSTFIFRKSNPQLSTLALSIFIIAFTVPIGTDNGITHYNCILPPIFAIIFAFINNLDCSKTLLLKNKSQKKDNLEKGKLRNIIITKKYMKTSISLLCLMLLVVSVKVSAYDLLFLYSYGDSTYLSERTYTSVPALGNMKTVKLRADQLSNYYNDLQSEELKGKKLAITTNNPITYLITDQKPFFRVVWPDLQSLPYEEYCIMLEDAARINEFPIIAISNFDQVNRFRPSAKRDYLLQYVKKYNYIEFSNQTLYQIYYKK